MVPLSSEVTSRCQSKHSAISILSLTGSGRDDQERRRLVLAGAIREDFTEQGTEMGRGRIWRGGDKGKQSRRGSTIGEAGVIIAFVCKGGSCVVWGEGKYRTMKCSSCWGEEDPLHATFGW